jgi:hypothetical protein
MLTLERNGQIRRQPGIARRIRVLVDPEALPQLRPSHDQRVTFSVQRYEEIVAVYQSSIIDCNTCRRTMQ